MAAKADAWHSHREREHRALSDRIADLERQRHEFFNELTVLSALLQMKAPDRAQQYLDRILATHKQVAAGETAAARLSAVSEGKEAMEFPSVPVDLSPVFGTLVAIKRRAREEGVRFQLRISLDNTAVGTPDPYFPQALAHLMDYALESVRGAEPGRRRVELEMTWAPEGESLEVWSSGTPVDSRLLEPGAQAERMPEGRGVALNSLGEVRRWARERGGRMKVRRVRGGTSFRLEFPSQGSPFPGPH